MSNMDLKAYLIKGLVFISSLVILGLALIGSFYLVIAGLVVMLSVSLISRMGLKPQTVKASAYMQPLHAKYRVVRRD